jgi:ribosomal protein S18 acetylase RimI-like enzyme
MSKEKILAEAKEYDFIIREFQKTKADAELLAACYRTWDDPESWPGGFGHDDPPTAERILQSLETYTPLAHFVAESENKIVGKCDVLEHFFEDDTVYIGLLGVAPAYQGKKIGKNLLLTAINKAVELKKDIITLHTWGGNLKAVPLYKKTGFFWAPETSVYMENFLPGILSNDLFTEFFEQYYWYDVYDRDLAIKEDCEKINDMLVYNYQFRGDEKNALKVVIDQKAKKMCGFELTTSVGTIAAMCFVDNYIGFGGYDRVPITWKLTNNTSEAITFSIIVDSHEDIFLEEKPPISHCLQAGSTKEIKAYVKLLPTIKTVSNSKESHERTKYQLTSKLFFKNKETALAVGVVPVDPLEVTIQPEPQSLLPGQEVELPIRLFNRTDRKMKGSLVIEEQSMITFQQKKINLQLEQKESKDIQLPIQVASDFTGHQVPIEMTFYLEDKNKLIALPKEKIVIAVLNNALQLRPNCTGYLIKDRFAILENRNIRIQVMLQPPYKINYIESKVDGKKYWIHTAIPDLGMPFGGSSNELARAEQKTTLNNQFNKTELILEVPSEKKEGIIIRRIFRLLPNTETLQIQTEIINSSTKQHKNIGLRLISQTWGDGITDEGKAYLPLTKGLLELRHSDSFYRNTHFPQKQEEWKESWFGVTFEENKVFGAIWQKEQLQKIEFRSFYPPTFEYFFATDRIPIVVERQSFLFLPVQ